MFSTTKLISALPLLFIVSLIASSSAHAEEPNGSQPTEYEDICAVIIEKNANSEDLTPEEGDALVNCFYRQDHSGNGLGPGFQAHQAPPSLYDLYEFDDFPGVLGDGRV